MLDGFWLSCVILLAMTIGVLYFRYASRALDSNWPVVYYVLALLHLQLFPEGLAANFVYAAVIAAALMRFEFMGGWFLKIVQTLEYGCLLYIAYRLFDLIYL